LKQGEEGREMKTLLQIGEIAQLLGVTTKAIRHYQKIGLLAEPERTKSGYRLYTAQDLLRLQRIKRLQVFGLSLKQIEAVLGDGKQEQTLREVLQLLDQEFATQIQELEQRRQKIQTLLAEASSETFSVALNTSSSAEFVKEHLGNQLAHISGELWEQELQLYNYLDNFQWTENQQEKMQHITQQFVQYFVEHPEEYQQILVLAERFSAIASLSKDEPEVQRLVEDFPQHFVHYPFMKELRANIQDSTSQQESPFTRIFMDLLQSVYSPAQEYVLREIGHKLEASLTRENTP